jgi:hypothetical protein
MEAANFEDMILGQVKKNKVNKDFWMEEKSSL